MGGGCVDGWLVGGREGGCCVGCGWVVDDNGFIILSSFCTLDLHIHKINLNRTVFLYNEKINSISFHNI